MRIVTCGVFAALMLVGCSKPAAGDAAPSTETGATDGSCGLLKIGEVRRVLPEAARSEHVETLAKYDIDGCDWYGSGKAPVLEVRLWKVTGADDTPMDNARTLAMGIADPTRAGADEAVRLEKLGGIGEDAVAIVEKSDEARGILTSGALISLQKNGHIATLATTYLDVGDRAKVLEQLATLGKAVAARM